MSGKNFALAFFSILKKGTFIPQSNQTKHQLYQLTLDMFSHKNQLNSKFIGSTKKLIHGCFKTSTVFCLILVFFNSIDIVKADNNQSWGAYFDYYEKSKSLDYPLLDQTIYIYLNQDRYIHSVINYIIFY